MRGCSTWRRCLRRRAKLLSRVRHTSPAHSQDQETSMQAPTRRDAPVQWQPTPHHIAIIMDGNGRWAHQRGLPRLLGHRAGSKNVRSIILASITRRIRYLTLYVFSTENWSRPAYEVTGLMRLLSEVIVRE